MIFGHCLPMLRLRRSCGVACPEPVAGLSTGGFFSLFTPFPVRPERSAAKSKGWVMDSAHQETVLDGYFRGVTLSAAKGFRLNLRFFACGSE